MSVVEVRYASGGKESIKTDSGVSMNDYRFTMNGMLVRAVIAYSPPMSGDYEKPSE